MPLKRISTAPASIAGPRSGSRPWTLALTSVAFFHWSPSTCWWSSRLCQPFAANSGPVSRRSNGREWLYPRLRLGIITGAALGDRFGRRRIFGIGS